MSDEEMTSEERLAHLAEATLFYSGMPVFGGKIQMDIEDAQFLIQLAVEALAERKNK